MVVRTLKISLECCSISCCELCIKPHCESKLVSEAAERPQWPRLYSSGRPRSCDRMPSLVVDCGPMLGWQGWALTRMLLQYSRNER